MVLRKSGREPGVRLIHNHGMHSLGKRSQENTARIAQPGITMPNGIEFHGCTFLTCAWDCAARIARPGATQPWKTMPKCTWIPGLYIPGVCLALHRAYCTARTWMPKTMLRLLMQVQRQNCTIPTDFTINTDEIILLKNFVAPHLKLKLLWDSYV